MKFLKRLFKKKRKIQKTDLTRRFDLIGRVGQGSMSKVWRARDTMSGKMVAVKVLDKRKTLRYESRFAGLDKPTEGAIAVQLKHPHIVRTYEHGWTMDEEQFLVMDFVEGLSLSFLVDVQNEIMLKNRLRFSIEIGSALDYFHSQNWIHRDVCPRNVLLDEDYRVKLIDFGLVVPNTEAFQQPGNRTGTVNYMAPELIKRLRTDQRIDVFSYALTCFEIYTSRLPWDAGDTFDTVVQRINSPPLDIRKPMPEIDEQVAETIMRGMEPSPDMRWSTVAQMLEAFREARLRIEGVGEEETENEDVE